MTQQELVAETEYLASISKHLPSGLYRRQLLLIGQQDELDTNSIRRCLPSASSDVCRGEPQSCEVENRASAEKVTTGRRMPQSLSASSLTLPHEFGTLPLALMTAASLALRASPCVRTPRRIRSFGTKQKNIGFEPNMTHAGGGAQVGTCWRYFRMILKWLSLKAKICLASVRASERPISLDAQIYLTLVCVHAPSYPKNIYCK